MSPETNQAEPAPVQTLYKNRRQDKLTAMRGVAAAIVLQMLQETKELRP